MEGFSLPNGLKFVEFILFLNKTRPENLHRKPPAGVLMTTWLIKQEARALYHEREPPANAPAMRHERATKGLKHRAAALLSRR